MRIVIADDEQIGKYKIETQAVDNLSAESMQLISYFTAIDSK
jgi:hypothetical protein